MTQKYEACAPDGIGRVIRWPMKRIDYSPHGLKYETFQAGEVLTAAELPPWTNIAVLVAGGHLRPVADDAADQPPTNDKEAV